MELPIGTKYAVVTGASAGIGREVVREFAKMGDWKVFAIARRMDLLESLAAEFPSGQIIPITLDVSLYDNSRLVSTLSTMGVHDISVVINNAGLLVNRPFETISIQEWELVFKSNVIGPALFIRDLLPYLGQRGVSHVVNISSMGGLSGTVKFPGLAAYSSSKGALSVLTEVLAEEFKDRNIDIDLLLWEKTIVNTQNLQLPHPEILNRKFVLHYILELSKTNDFIKLNFLSKMDIPHHIKTQIGKQ